MGNRRTNAAAAHPRHTRFLIRDGREICIDPAPGRSPAELAGFLTGSVFGALLHQRGCFVLHASAVAVDGAAAIFCGPSGSGKSVLAAALCAAGHAWIADEICSVQTRAGVPVALPDGHRLKLWSDSIAGLCLDRGPRDPVRPGIEKFWLDPPRPAVPHALPVRAIYFLHSLRPSLLAGIQPVGLLDALASLRAHAYRPRLIQAFGREQAWLEESACIARRAAAWHLTRELSFGALPGCVQMLERHWSR